jgi:hypothetical protein
MSVFVTLALIGLLIARELLTAYQGADIGHSGRMRWLNYAILVGLLAFAVVMTWQIVFLLLTV